MTPPSYHRPWGSRPEWMEGMTAAQVEIYRRESHLRHTAETRASMLAGANRFLLVALLVSAAALFIL